MFDFFQNSKSEAYSIQSFPPSEEGVEEVADGRLDGINPRPKGKSIIGIYLFDRHRECCYAWKMNLWSFHEPKTPRDLVGVGGGGEKGP